MTHAVSHAQDQSQHAAQELAAAHNLVIVEINRSTTAHLDITNISIQVDLVGKDVDGEKARLPRLLLEFVTFFNFFSVGRGRRENKRSDKRELGHVQLTVLAITVKRIKPSSPLHQC